MWVMVCFDLPTVSKDDRHNYAIFRKFLQSDGFTQLQKSIYVRHCMSVDKAHTHMKRVENHVPEKGNVIILHMTDKEFAAIKIIESGNTLCKQTDTTQLLLFDNNEMSETYESNNVDSEYLDRFQEDDSDELRNERCVKVNQGEVPKTIEKKNTNLTAKKRDSLTKGRRKKTNKIPPIQGFLFFE